MTKLSFTTMGTPEQDARGAIEFASRFGYQGIDLRISAHKGEIQPDAIDNDLKNVRSILDSEGIELAGLLSYNAVGSEDPASWQAMTDFARSPPRNRHRTQLPVHPNVRRQPLRRSRHRRLYQTNSRMHQRSP